MAKGKYEKWREKESLILLEGWAREGFTDEQIAKKIGISSSTFYEWNTKYPEISESIKKGKEVSDYEVENALFRRAVGLTVTETTEEENENGEKKTKTVHKEIPPDTGAAAFWLKNRRPDKWRDHPTNETNQTLEQLDALLKEFRDAVK